MFEIHYNLRFLITGLFFSCFALIHFQAKAQIGNDCASATLYTPLITEQACNIADNGGTAGLCNATNDDGWARFAATANRQYTLRYRRTSGGGDAAIIGIYKGACGGLTELVTCTPEQGNSTVHITFTATTTEDHFIRVINTANNAMDGQLTIYQSDDVSTPSVLPVYTRVCDANYAATIDLTTTPILNFNFNLTNNSVDGSVPSPNCPGLPTPTLGRDGWLKVTSAFTGPLVISYSPTTLTQDIALVVYDALTGCIGPPLVQDNVLQCANQNGAGCGETVTISAQVGRAYYIRVISTTNVATNGTLTIYAGPRTPYDLLVDALTVNIGTCNFDFVVLPTFLNNEGRIGPSCAASPFIDGWARINLTAGERIRINYNSTNKNNAIAVYSGSCGSLTELACSNSNPSSGLEEVEFNVAISGVHYIRIMNMEDDDAMDGQLCISRVVARDDCATAFAATATHLRTGDCNVKFDVLSSFTADVHEAVCSSNDGLKSAWAVYRPTVTTNVRLEYFTPVFDPNALPDMMVYDAGLAGTAATLPCTNPAAANIVIDLAAQPACVINSGSTYVFTDFQAQAGHVYFIKIMVFDGSIDMRGFLCVYDRTKVAEDFFYTSNTYVTDGTDCGEQFNINSNFENFGGLSTADFSCGTAPNQNDAWANFDIASLPSGGMTVSFDNDNDDATIANDVAMTIYRGESLTPSAVVPSADCATAPLLPLNEKTNAFSLDAIIDGVQPVDFSCNSGGTAMGDNWVTFTGTTDVTAVFDFSTGDAGLELWEQTGVDCTTLSFLQCSSPFGFSSDGAVALTATGLNAGSTYYVRIVNHEATTTGTLTLYNLLEIGCANAVAEGVESIVLNNTVPDFQAGFRYYIRIGNLTAGVATTNGKLCLTNNNVPEGDLCTNAFELLVGDCDIDFDLENIYVNDASITPNCGPGSFFRDVWFAFTALTSTTTVDYTNFTNTANTNAAIEAFRGSTCGSLVFQNCYEFGNGAGTPTGTTGKLVLNTVPGAKYYVRIMNVGTNNADIDGNLCIYDTPERDNCNDNDLLTKVVGECNIQFDVPSSFTLSEPIGFRDIIAGLPITETGGSITQTVQSACDIDVNNPGGTPWITLDPAATPVDDCASLGYTMTTNTTTDEFTINAASLGTPAPDATCAPNASGDVWFRFVGGTTPSVEFSFTHTTGDASIELYEDIGCGSLTTPLNCTAAAGINGAGLKTLRYTSIVNGTTYFIRVVNNSTVATTGYFSITTDPPAKDAWMRVIGNGNEVTLIYENRTATANPAIVVYTALKNVGPATCGVGSNGVSYNVPFEGANQYACANSNNTASAQTEFVTFQTNAGQIYFIRMIDLTGTGMQGTMCISDGTQTYEEACDAREVNIGDCSIPMNIVDGNVDCYDPAPLDPSVGNDLVGCVGYGDFDLNTDANDCEYGDVFATFKRPIVCNPANAPAPAGTTCANGYVYNTATGLCDCPVSSIRPDYPNIVTIQYDNRDGYATTAGDVSLVVYQVSDPAKPTNCADKSQYTLIGCSNSVVEGVETIQITGLPLTAAAPGQDLNTFSSGGEEYIIRIIRKEPGKTVFGKLCLFYGTSVASVTCPPTNSYGDLNGEYRDFTIPATTGPTTGVGYLPSNTIPNCVIPGGSTPRTRSSYPIRSQAWMQFTVPNDADYNAVTVQYDNTGFFPLRNMAIAIYAQTTTAGCGDAVLINPAACANTVFVGAESVTFTIQPNTTYFVRVMNIHNVNNPDITSGRIRVFPFAPCTRGDELVTDGNFAMWPAIRAGADGLLGDNDEVDNSLEPSGGGFRQQNDNLMYIPNVGTGSAYPNDLDRNMSVVADPLESNPRVNTGVARFATDYGFLKDRINNGTELNSGADFANINRIRRTYQEFTAIDPTTFVPINGQGELNPEGLYLIRQSPWSVKNDWFGFSTQYSGYGGRTGGGVPKRSYCASGGGGFNGQPCIPFDLDGVSGSLPMTTGEYNPNNGVGGLDLPEPFPATSDANFMIVNGSFDPNNGLPPGKVWCQTIERQDPDAVGYYIFEVWVQNMISTGRNLDVPQLRLTVCDMENPFNLNQDPIDAPVERDILAATASAFGTANGISPKLTRLPGITYVTPAWTEAITVGGDPLDVLHLPLPPVNRLKAPRVDFQYGAAVSCNVNAEMASTLGLPQESRDARLKVLGSSFLITEDPDRWTLIRCIYRAPKGLREMNICIENLSITKNGNDFAIDDISFRQCQNPNTDAFDKLLKGDPCELSDNPLESTLPATLIDFSGKLLGDKVFLNWTTAIELNTVRYDVQRSTDGLNFQTIGGVDAKGTTQGFANYNYIDNKLPLGVNTLYYRLNMVDANGLTKLGPIISVGIQELELFDMKLIPNPINSGEEVEVQFDVPVGKAGILVTDIMGNRLSAEIVDTKEGINSHFIKTGRYASGIYIVKVTHSSGQSVAKKLLVR